MRVGRLTIKIYLFSLFAVLATVGTFVATALTLLPEHRQEMKASSHLVRSLWLSQQEDASGGKATGAAQYPGSDVTLYDNDGRLLVSTVAPPLPMPSPSHLVELREKGYVEVGHTIVAHEVRNQGRVVAIGIVTFRGLHSHGRLVPALLLLLVALLAVAVTFARHLTRPLQHVAYVARKFGEGDLGARVGNGTKDEIGEVGRAFDAMADRVAGLMSAQQELMANVSHELRTPLSRVQVAVDLIADGKSDQVTELVPDIAQDLGELDRLIDDVMTVAKLDLSRSARTASVLPLHREVSSINSLIDEAISRFRSLHPKRELAVAVAADLPELSADPVLLRRVIDNLLENAHKFSGHDTEIRISASFRNALVTIAIADSGIGIDEADAENVFTPFFRVDKSRSRSTGGVGLGLALARRVVEAHEGTIEITSKPGQGTTVTLTLPAPATHA